MMNNQIIDLLNVSLTGIKDIANVNVVVGDPITLAEKLVVPVAKVKCSFASGGMDQKYHKTNEKDPYPFGGATGGIMSITPIAFLVFTSDDVKLLHLDETSHLYERLIDDGYKIVTGIMKKMENSHLEN